MLIAFLAQVSSCIDLLSMDCQFCFHHRWVVVEHNVWILSTFVVLHAGLREKGEKPMVHLSSTANFQKHFSLAWAERHSASFVAYQCDLRTVSNSWRCDWVYVRGSEVNQKRHQYWNCVAVQCHHGNSTLAYEESQGPCGGAECLGSGWLYDVVSDNEWHGSVLMVFDG